MYSNVGLSFHETVPLRGLLHEIFELWVFHQLETQKFQFLPQFCIECFKLCAKRRKRDLSAYLAVESDIFRNLMRRKLKLSTQHTAGSQGRKLWANQVLSMNYTFQFDCHCPHIINAEKVHFPPITLRKVNNLWKVCFYIPHNKLWKVLYGI